MNTNPYLGGERVQKINSNTSNQTRKPNFDQHLNQLNILNVESNKKQMTYSPINAYSSRNKLLNSKSIDMLVNTEKQPTYLEDIIKELNEKVNKISQKIMKHENILIKITENSIQNNKQEYKRNHDPKQHHEFTQFTEQINEKISSMQKEHEDFKSNFLPSKEDKIKVQLFSELIHKSEERMKEEFLSVIKKNHSIQLNQSHHQDKIEDIEKNINEKIKKIEKGLSTHSQKIFSIDQRIDGIDSSIAGHMDLINLEVNKAISKIVTFINEKVSKPLNQKLASLTIKTQDLEKCSKDMYKFNNYKTSLVRSEKQKIKAQYQEIFNINSQQIIISEKIYYIDMDGYLLDHEYFYLIDLEENRVKLDSKQIQLLISEKIVLQ